MPLSNEDIGQLLSALAETPQFKFLDSLMAQGEGGPEGGEDAGGGLEPAPDGGGFGEEEQGGDLNDVQDLLVDDDEFTDEEDLGGPEDTGSEVPPVPEDDNKPEKNSPGFVAPLMAAGRAAGPALAQAGRAIAPKAAQIAMHPATIAGTAGYLGARAGSKKRSMVASGDLATKYSRIQTAHNKLVQEHGRLASQMDQLLREKCDAERVAALQGLAGQYPDFIDLDAEFKATLYSRGAKMGEQAFAGHLATVEKYAHRSAMVSRSERPDIPLGEISRPAREGHNDKYAARLAKTAVAIHTKAINAGQPGFTWDEAKAQAEKLLAGRE